MLDTRAKRIALGVALGLLVVLVWPHVRSVQPAKLTQAVVIYESSAGPLTRAQVQVLTNAARWGVWIVDKDILGPGKRPSPQLAPFLKAIQGKPLPVLVCSYQTGEYVVHPLPETVAQLKELLHVSDNH